MTITVQCRCGSRFAAQPHLAGKTVRCPSCQSPLAIPRPQQAAARVPQQATPQQAQPVVVSCRCGQRFKAQPHLFGKTVPCPSCRSPIAIQAPSARPQAPSVRTQVPSVFDTDPLAADPLAATDPFAGLGDFSASAPQPTFPMSYGQYGTTSVARPSAAKLSPAQRKARDNQISLLLGVPGLLLHMICSVAIRAMESPPVIAFPGLLLGWGLLIAGLCLFARSKGYNPLFGLFGLLGCIGLIVLAALPDKLETASSKSSSQKRTGVLLVVLFAVGGVFVIIVLLALLIPAIAAARKAAQKMAEQNAAGGQSGAGPSGFGGLAASEHWTVYKSADGGYQIEMPGQPRERPAMGAGFTVRLMEVQRPDGQLFQVGHIDFPPFTEFDAQAGFDGGVQSAAQVSAGTITSQQDSTVNGNPTRDFTWNGKILGHSITGRGRFISVGRRLYQMLWIAPTASTPGDVDRFFNSFQITTTASSPAKVQQSQPTGETSPGETSPGVTSPPFPPQESSGELTLDRKQKIFSDWMDIKKFEEDSREFVEKFPENLREQVKQQRERSKQIRVDTLLRRYGITAEQLVEIEVEGMANSWPSSP